VAFERRRRSDFDIQNKILAIKLWPTKIRLSNRTSVLVAKEIVGKNSTTEFYENMALVRGAGPRRGWTQ
jgi:hypothetical protein